MKPAEAYILSQEEPFKSILLHLQLIIEQNFPEVVLEFKWRIPFYYLDGNPFCFLNPSKKKKYVDVGFYGINGLEQYNDILISEGRKKVRSLRYTTIEDINSDILVDVLTLANKNKEQGFWRKK